LRPDLHIPPDVSKLVMTALEKDRENRYRSAEEMERAIAAVLDSWRIERERRERESAETARLAAEQAERERRQREEAEATRLAAERTERERAEATRLAGVRAEQERLARAEAERKRQEQAARHPPREDYGGTTRISGERKPRRRALTYGVAGLAITLAAAGFFIARYPGETPGPPPPAVVAAPKGESLSTATAGPPTGTRQTEYSARVEAPRKAEIAKNPARAPAVEKPQEKPPVPQLRVRTIPRDGLRYLWIPPGTFTMGCSTGDSECIGGEKPAHRVTITKGFWLGQTEVTQAAWQRVVGTDPSHFKGSNLPVETVTWDEAQAYCRAVGGRLPTEAEWEYAARAGSSQSRYGDIDAIAWYGSNSGGQTHEVAQKQANAFGLYDMLGNVWEWTADWYGGYTPGSAVDPTGPASGQFRALRGGSWSLDPRNARVSYRGGVGPGNRSGYIGLRCVGE